MLCVVAFMGVGVKGERELLGNFRCPLTLLLMARQAAVLSGEVLLFFLQRYLYLVFAYTFLNFAGRPIRMPDFEDGLLFVGQGNSLRLPLTFSIPHNDWLES